MIKKYMIQLTILLSMALLSTSFVSATENSVQDVSVADYKIYLDRRNRTSELQNDLLLRNDTTYIAARDIAEILGYDIEWNEAGKAINFSQKILKHKLFEKEETALKIAKAIIEEKYADKVNENTEYEVRRSRVSRSRYYDVYVSFNYKAMEDSKECDVYELADVLVVISAERRNIPVIYEWSIEKDCYLDEDGEETELNFGHVYGYYN